jgi:hypothetical protein
MERDKLTTMFVSQAQNQPNWQEEFKRMWTNHDKWKLHFKSKHSKTKNNKKTSTQSLQNIIFMEFYLKHGKNKTRLSCKILV